MSLTAGTLSIVLSLFTAPPQDEKALKPAIDRFKEQYYKVGAKDDEKIDAVNYLSQNHHERIVKVLAPLMAEASLPVRIMIARSLGQFSDVELAGRELDTALMAQANSGKKQSSVRIEILRSLGALRFKAAGADVSKLVNDKEVWVAKAAIDASQKVRAQEAIEPLIRALHRIEGKEGEAAVTSDPLDDLVEGVGKNDLYKRDPRQPKRGTERELLREPILSALQSLTKQSFPTSKEWSDWWSKNKSTFRVAD